MTDKDMIALHEHYKAGEVSEETTHHLLGNEFDPLREDIEVFAAAVDENTSQYLV